MARWTFLRHGESRANAEGWFSGHRDVPLTDRGMAQAREAAATLADVPFAQAWSSDLQRAARTADLVLERRPLTAGIDARLRERSLGVFEGQDRTTLRQTGQTEVLLTWTGAPEGGESHRDLAVRALPFMAEIDGRGDALIVAHGGLIRVLIGLVDGLAHEELGRVSYANCVPHHREIEVGRWASLARDLA